MNSSSLGALIELDAEESAHVSLILTEWLVRADRLAIPQNHPPRITARHLLDRIPHEFHPVGPR